MYSSGRYQVSLGITLKFLTMENTEDTEKFVITDFSQFLINARRLVMTEGHFSS